MIEIAVAQTGDALEQFIALAQDYVTWMTAEIQMRYPSTILNELISEHDYDDVRQKFPRDHIPPQGCLLIATDEGQVCGGIALGKLSPTICEVRTLFVRPDCRGSGVGRQLVGAVLNKAREFGYTYARLDTLAFMDNAQRLYRSVGFRDIEPYLEFSAALKQYVRFFELKL
jgi:N-acetylglutamate synthase-like GNAT family acetyltransferase